MSPLFLFFQSPVIPPEINPLPSDYWHVSNARYSASAYAPQPVFIGTGVASVSTSSNTIRAVPFFVGRLGRTVSALGVTFVTAPGAGRVLKVGIYNTLPPSNHNVYPQSLVASVSFAPVNSATTQSASLTPVELQNGLYWIVYGQGTASSMTFAALNTASNNSTAGRNPLQWTTTTLNTILSVALPDASVMPSTFPAGATMVSSSIPLFEVL